MHCWNVKKSTKKHTHTPLVPRLPEYISFQQYSAPLPGWLLLQRTEFALTFIILRIYTVQDFTRNVFDLNSTWLDLIVI